MRRKRRERVSTGRSFPATLNATGRHGLRSASVLGVAFWVAIPFVPTAHADTAPQRRLPPIVFSGAPSCMDAETFRRRLSALPASAAPTPSPQSVTVRIASDGGSFAGEVQVKHADGITTVRRVVAQRCDEVTEALEFIAALAMGLEATSAPEPSVAPHSPSPDIPKEHATWRVLGAVRAAMVNGAGPDPEFGPELVIGLAFDAKGWWAPSLELSGRWTKSGTVDTASGAVTLTLVSGAATACPVQWVLGAGFGVRPCIEFTAGQLSGSASGAHVVGSTQAQAWAALTPQLRVEWAPSRSLRMQAEGGPDFHFDQDRFFFVPSGVPVYKVPFVGNSAQLGVSVIFP